MLGFMCKLYLEGKDEGSQKKREREKKAFTKFDFWWLLWSFFRLTWKANQRFPEIDFFSLINHWPYRVTHFPFSFQVGYSASYLNPYLTVTFDFRAERYKCGGGLQILELIFVLNPQILPAIICCVCDKRL